MERVNSLTFGLVLLISGAWHSAHADPDSWQAAQLFNPTSPQLEAERRGRVMIYSGLTDKMVDRALDEQFDRMQSMMFTKTVVTDETGMPLRDPATNQVVVEDDGC